MLPAINGLLNLRFCKSRWYHAIFIFVLEFYVSVQAAHTRCSPPHNGSCCTGMVDHFCVLNRTAAFFLAEYFPSNIIFNGGGCLTESPVYTAVVCSSPLWYHNLGICTYSEDRLVGEPNIGGDLCPPYWRRLNMAIIFRDIQITARHTDHCIIGCRFRQVRTRLLTLSRRSRASVSPTLLRLVALITPYS